MNWTEKHIRELKAEGKIRGFNIPEQPKNRVVIPESKPKGILWLDLNLEYWCKQRSLILDKEYKFCPDRKFKSDYAIVSLKILIEYEGGIFMERSGHNSATGIQRDIDKYTLANKMGFTVIRVTAMNYMTVLKTLNEMTK